MTITFIESIDPVTQEVTEHALIKHADGSFTSMLKSTYESQQLEHLTEIVPTSD